MRGLFLLSRVEQSRHHCRRADCPILAGECRLLGSTGFLFAAWHFDFPKVKGHWKALQMMADSDQIVAFST